MKPHRKITFLFAVGALVAAACVVGVVLLAPTILRRGYQSGNAPEAIAHNYLMALVRQDRARAYSYLSPALSQYPVTVDGFWRDLEEHGLLPVYELRPCVYVESVETEGDCAIVGLRVQYYDPCLRGGLDFQNLAFNQVRLELERVGDEWRVVGSEGGFFYKGWAYSGE